MNQILSIYNTEIRAKDLTHSSPKLHAVRKLPDIRSIAIINNHKQRILVYRRRKVAIEYLIESLENESMTLESIRQFTSEQEGQELVKGRNKDEIISVLEDMKQ